ncbi:MAG: hypothetical protein IKX36_10740 [Prevotella sp.]|nr:hypothetical protein [Prevotella sp.]
MKKTYIQPDVKSAEVYAEELLGVIITGSDGNTVTSDTEDEEEEDDYDGAFHTNEVHIWEDIYYRTNLWERH